MIKLDTSKVVNSSGILYMLLIDLEDKRLVKFGFTCREHVEDRICEILTSCWKTYRVFPRCETKRFRTVDNVEAKEALLLEFFKEFRYETKNKFSGSTELFDLDVGIAVEAYRRVLDGVALDVKFKHNLDNFREIKV